MTSFTELFGDKLLNGPERVSTDVLSGKITLVYFSAHWCGPCRSFTPQLIQWYNQMKANGVEFDIVFASSDRSASDFNSYYGSMPWLALPYSEREKKEALSKKFKVRGIPTLVILDSDGTTITTKGRMKVMQDPNGLAFPYRPKSLESILQGPLLTGNGKETIEFSSLSGKTLGLLFSASWCGPCQQFSPRLAHIYRRLQESGRDDFEIILVSGDRSESDFNGYFGHQPWKAIPFTDQQRINELNDHFEVEGIPTLVMLNGDLSIINASAVGDAMHDTQGDKFPWVPPPMQDLSRGVNVGEYDINDNASLIVFMENADDDDKQDSLSVLTDIAQNYLDAAKSSGSDPELIFFTATETGPLINKIRTLTQLPDVRRSEDIIMVILDIQNRKVYRSSADEVTTDTVQSFIQDWKDGNLSGKTLQL